MRRGGPGGARSSSGGGLAGRRGVGADGHRACGGGSGLGGRNGDDPLLVVGRRGSGPEPHQQRLIALFEKKYPKIKVKTDFQPYTDFWKKFNTQPPAGIRRSSSRMPSAFLRKYDAKNKSCST
ncbi:hypothetical protein LV779_16335 [Streptomyces thinghirensis]|nr:hypothetical protein [Streptomyces thinghirensis]